VKRLFDVCVSAVALIVLAPLLALVAIAVKFTSPGPVLYSSKRIGRDGHPFTLYKFRTMGAGSAAGPSITAAGDQRITPLGRLLRRSKIDEIPQLFNVIKGDMSLVGPRPEVERYVALYTPEQRLVLAVKPGITSPASIAYRNEESLLSGADWERQYVDHVMPDKLRRELEYLSRRTLWSDIRLILETVRAILH
jgi:lipopolysaccharide/colanic/teichoic acid biosynthesis glycosyltransferase